GALHAAPAHTIRTLAPYLFLIFGPHIPSPTQAKNSLPGSINHQRVIGFSERRKSTSQGVHFNLKVIVLLKNKTHKVTMLQKGLSRRDDAS
ncbi:TPA: hypothetical protein ACSTLY_005212, partial [Serratia fonticola]